MAELAVVVAEQQPICFIIGFLSSVPENFERVKKIYQDDGIETVVHCPSSLDPKDHTFQVHREVRSFINKILLPLVQNNNRPILFHLFSQNASIFFWYLWLKFDKVMKERVKGVAFDSTPCRYPTNAWKRIHATWYTSNEKDDATQNSNKFYTHHLPWAIPRYYAIAAVNHLLKLEDFYPDFIKCPDLPKQQLYFMTKDDTIVNETEVTKFVKAQIVKGSTVEYHLWESGFHCAHFIERPLEYEQITKRFIRRVLCIPETFVSKL